MKSVTFLSLWIGLTLIAGCGSGLEEFPVTQVSGVVLCDGRPVPNSMVYFEPVRSGKSAQTGKQGYALTDEQGRFVISTYGSNDGAVVGTHIVRVGKSQSTPECGCALNAGVELRRLEVVEGPPMNIELVLPKKSARMKDEVLDDEEDDD